jgi:hypothetical protein
MNTGVEILLQRLKDCPEDFDYDISSGLSSRWLKLVQKALASDFITQEEKDALTEALRENHRNEFTEHVMKTLAGEGESSDEGKSPYLANGILTGGQTLASSLAVHNGGTGTTWGTTTINNSLEQAILRQQQALDTALRLKIFDDHPPKRKSIIREYWEIIKDFKNT